MSKQEGSSRRPPNHPGAEPPWVHSHAHEPNLQSPAGDGDFVISTPGGGRQVVSPGDLQALPYTSVADCFIVSTGHGTSGPFTFGGVRLGDLIDAILSARTGAEPGERTVADRGEYRSGYRGEGREEDGTAPQPPAWQHVDLVSADGFGTRLTPADLAAAGDRPVLLAYRLDGTPLTRKQGLVRLIVPTETDDALRQVKWLATITIV
jgi:DMSO/TMAO reductase YedYZ molybdopterin-dependent catalytic subunit